MNPFRAFVPKRRPINTKVKKYTEHRVDLRADYGNRCGYCSDIDSWRVAWFEIDHFVPKQYLKTIEDTDYSNLVYACRSCNNAKRAKWPTKEEAIHNHNDEGFIDPCDKEYGNQFARLDNGRIIPTTRLGEWIYKALKLYKPQHEIIWNIELVNGLIDEIENVVEYAGDDQIKGRLLECYQQFRKYINALGEIGL